MKRALITGISGQDGSYLAEYLLGLGYEVHGTVRLEAKYYKYLDKIRDQIHLHYADMKSEVSLEWAIRKSDPDEIYNLAGHTFVPLSWMHPEDAFDVNASGLARILNIVQRLKPTVRVYQASSSEMFGNSIHINKVPGSYTVPLSETSEMQPVSPYGVSKLAAHKLVDVYRQRGLFVVSGILFNHESGRRGIEMVTRKITRHVAGWIRGDLSPLRLGNASSKRDWGFAGDYVKAMHAMLQQPVPADYVIGTGEAHSVAEFIDAAINATGLSTYGVKVEFDCPEFSRKNELHILVADASKARRELGWEPETSFEELVKLMVESDLESLHEPETDVVSVCRNAAKG